jgi:hypothetical protein
MSDANDGKLIQIKCHYCKKDFKVLHDQWKADRMGAICPHCAGFDRYGESDIIRD